MKRLVKAFLVLTMVLGITGTATSAYFTSSVTAADNEIVTGTLMLAIDSTQTHTDNATWTFPHAYNVVRDVDGVVTKGNSLETWTNAEPGSYVTFSSWPREKGNFSYWVAVRNRGSLDMYYRLYPNQAGAWSLTRTVDELGNSCGTGDPSLVRVRNVHRYAVTPSGGCESDEECRNLRDALQGMAGYSWTPTTTSAIDVAGNPLNNFGNDVLLKANEFAIYRVDMQLVTSAGNCYQDATYSYEVSGEARQENGTY